MPKDSGSRIRTKKTNTLSLVYTFLDHIVYNIKELRKEEEKYL